MKKFFILAAFLLAGSFCVYPFSQTDTVQIVKHQTKVIASRKGKLIKKHLTFLLEDKRLIEISNRPHGSKTSAPHKGIIYEYDESSNIYIESQNFRTCLENWTQARDGQKVIIRGNGRKCKCFLQK